MVARVQWMHAEVMLGSISGSVWARHQEAPRRASTFNRLAKCPAGPHILLGLISIFFPSHQLPPVEVGQMRVPLAL